MEEAGDQVGFCWSKEGGGSQGTWSLSRNLRGHGASAQSSCPSSLLTAPFSVRALLAAQCSSHWPASSLLLSWVESEPHHSFDER